MNKLTAEDYLTLIKAGYSKSEIDAIGSERTEKEPAEITEPIPETAEVTKTEQAEVKTEVKPEPDKIEMLSGEVRELKQMMEKYFISNDSFEKTKENIANNILASVINPPHK